MLLVFYALLIVAFGADTTLTRQSFLASLDNDKLLRYAKLCKAVFKLTEGKRNDQQTRELLSKQVIDPDCWVCMQGYRHEGRQLGAVLIKDGHEVNKFALVFSGTETLDDVLTDINALGGKDDAKVKLDRAVRKQFEKPRGFVEKWTPSTKRRKDHHPDGLKVHRGFMKAGEPFLKELMVRFKEFITPGKPIVITILGHSMGAALATQAAYEIKHGLPTILWIDEDELAVELITFAGAGFFKIQDADRAGVVFGAEHSAVHFYRKNDLARELTLMAGYVNPGNNIFLDNFVQVEGTVTDFLSECLHLEETPMEISECIKKAKANHSINNYIITIHAGISLLTSNCQVEST